MSKLILVLAGLLTAIGIAVYALGFQGTSSADHDVDMLVKAYDDAIYIDTDRKAALGIANEIVSLADQTSNPNSTRARGTIRLVYANIVMGKWDGTWRKKVEECEALISDDSTVGRAEVLLYSGQLLGRWGIRNGKHEYEAGLERIEEALRVAKHVEDDRTISLAYVSLTELQIFLDRTDFITMNGYRAVSVANSYGEKSIRATALRNLLANMIFLDKIPEAVKVGERLLEVVPESTYALYPMFMTGSSTKLEDFARRYAKQFNNMPIDDPDRMGKRAILGNLLASLGKGYFRRKEYSKCCEALEQAIPHLKATNDDTTLRACRGYLQVGKLGVSPDVPSLDEVAATLQESIDYAAASGEENKTAITPNGVEVIPIFADFLSARYDDFGEREKSLVWREHAVAIRTAAYTKEVGNLWQSSELFWNSELSLREKTETNNKLADDSRNRIWQLSTALVMGLTVSTLLGGFYYLLRRKSNSLEDMVQARTDSLSKAMKKANAADHAKSDFLAQINHEIRNPLTAILAYCELLSLEKKEPNRLVAGIESSSLHLRELVDKILEVSKIESSGLEAQLVEFFPEQTAKDIHGIMAEQFAQQNLEFECTFTGDPNRLALSDETKIRQIALNLIGNAFKFTEKGSVKAAFKLNELSSPSHAELRITVNDTGMGIAKSDVKNVFERFTKASNATTRDGSGLGLYITKRLVECLGGEISLESSLGKGTQIRVALPVKFADAATSSQNTNSKQTTFSPNKPHSFSAKRVLVVDDQEVIRRALQLQLKSRGLECQTEWNLEQTIEVVENWRPHIVLLDLRMPNHSGFEVLEQIRKSKYGSVPVYAMTGDATVRTQQKCLSVGFDGFITKPFKIESILKILDFSNNAVASKS